MGRSKNIRTTNTKRKTKKKLENSATRYSAFSKRREGVFKKAHELSVLCQAEVAVILISGDGIVNEFASSSLQNTITKFKKCMATGTRCDSESDSEEPMEQVLKEVDVVRHKAEKHRIKQNILGKDLADMNLHELFVVEEKLSKGLLFIKDRKMQLLMEALKQSKIQEQQGMQKNQMLLRQENPSFTLPFPPCMFNFAYKLRFFHLHKMQVEELQRFTRQIYYPMPLSDHCPETERDADREFLPSTSFATPLANTKGHEFQDADRQFVPSTSFGPADKASLPSTSFAAPQSVDNSLKLSLQMNTLKPAFHWLPAGYSGKTNAA